MIAEFESLKWPLTKKTYVLKSKFFKNNFNFETFEKICEHYEKPVGQMVDELVTDLNYIISDNPIHKKIETAHKLQKFFDGFGNYSFYATREVMGN